MFNKTKNVALLIVLFVFIGLVLGLVVGGYAGWKSKKAKELAEQPLQAEKTQESKEQKNKRIKEQNIVKPIEARDWQIYENKNYKYKIKYPKGWHVFGREDTPWLINFTSYDTKDIDEENIPGVKIEILVQGNPKNLNIQDWVKEGHQFSGSPKNTKEIKISDLDAVWEELDFIGPTINVTIMRANDVFTISYTGKIPDYENFKGVFDKMLEEMEIEK